MQPALLQIQNDITGRLTVELASWGVTVRSQRAMIVAKEVDEAQLVFTLRNGKRGVGVLVQMPRFQNERPNVPGPIGFIEMTLTIKEAPELNMNASNGTLKSAEEVAGRSLELIQLWNVQSIGTFYGGTLRKSSVQEPNLVCYDVVVRMAYAYDVLTKTANPTISGTATAITITAAAGTIYYTTDGESFPGADQLNSFTYSAPFASSSGSVIRAVAYDTGSTGSNIVEYTVP